MDSINIKQLAEKLNLSKSTVSRAFQGHSDIKKETKDMILAMAKELNYQPNHMASNLRNKKSKSIAVIVPEIANNFFSRAINGIEHIARAEGFHVSIYLTDDDFEKEVSFISELHNGRVEGIIMSATGEAKDHSHMHRFRKNGVPLVFFDRIYDDIPTSRIETNDYESSYIATKHLIEQGCKRVVYLVVNKNLSIGKLRMQGYLDALEEAGLPVDMDCVIDCSNDLTVNKEILSKVLMHQKPDGIFASVERLALATYYTCHDNNILIGKDVKVICFSSLEIASLLNPPLSTITQPAYDMGQAAAKSLFQLLKANRGDVGCYEHRVLNSQLYIRESTLGY